MLDEEFRVPYMYVPPRNIYLISPEKGLFKKDNSSSNQQFSEDRLVFREVYVFSNVAWMMQVKNSPKEHDLRSNVKTVDYQQQAEITHHTESRSLYILYYRDRRIP